MYPKRLVKKCALFGGCSALLIVLGVAIICLRNILYNAIINKIFLLQPDSQAFDTWKKNPMPLTLKLYLFNWTNAADVHNSSVKPFFKQLGPYTFDETKEKVNITWNTNNNTVSFYHLKKWWFNPKESNGSLNDQVTSLNPIALSSAAAAKDWNFFLKRGLSAFLRTISPNVYSTHNAGDVLFNGYPDPLLSTAQSLPSFGISSLPDYDKFGWFYTRNNSETYEGQFNMDVGLTGQLGELYYWKYMQSSPYYPEQCGKIRGSAGEFFPNNLKKDTIITFFSPDLCRYVQLEFQKEVQINGIAGYKYIAGDRFLDNGTKIPENKCFCSGDCMPSGALNISACRYGSPSFVSLPHFYNADPYYTDIVDGLEPNQNDHEFFITFEPKTGIPLQVSARLQVNLFLQPISGIGVFDNVPKIYLPVLWFEQSVLISDDFIVYLTILTNFEAACLSIGIILIICSVIMETCYCYRQCTTNLTKSKQTPIKEEVPLKTHYVP